MIFENRQSSRLWDLQFFSSEKTEEATPRKRQKSREEGQTAKSQDLVAALIMMAGLLSMLALSAQLWNIMIELFHDAIRYQGSKAIYTETWLTPWARWAADAFLRGWLPIGLLAAIVAAASLLFQVGFVVTTKPLIPDFSRMNPISGMKKVISMRTIVEMIKGVLKASFLLLTLYFGVKKEEVLIMKLMRIPLPQGFSIIADRVWWLSMRMVFLLFVLGLFDYLYQKWEFEKSIRMSKQDIKDEYKQMEGDPLIKQRIRQRQRELAKGRMMADVPNADVVITNPTHLALALQYDKKSMAAPTLIAKGEGLVAEKIKEIAKEHDVPLVEDKPLARALFAQVEVGEPIPEDLYRTVAEVLAFVYSMRKDKN